MIINLHLFLINILYLKCTQLIYLLDVYQTILYLLSILIVLQIGEIIII